MIKVLIINLLKYSLELKSHKDKIAALNGEIQRLRTEQKRSADENTALLQKIDSLQFSLEASSKEIEKVRSQTQVPIENANKLLKKPEEYKLAKREYLQGTPGEKRGFGQRIEEPDPDRGRAA